MPETQPKVKRASPKLYDFSTDSGQSFRVCASDLAKESKKLAKLSGIRGPIIKEAEGTIGRRFAVCTLTWGRETQVDTYYFVEVSNV